MNRFCLALASLSVLAATPAASATDTFCERMAPQVGMKPTDKDQQPANGEWKVNMLGGLWNSLVGGSAMVSFSIHPVDETQASEFQRLQNVCQSVPDGVFCKIDGPANVGINSPKGQIRSVLGPDEHVELEMRRSVMFCRNK